VILIATGVGFWCAWAADFDKLQLILTCATFWWGLALLWIQSFPASATLWKPQFVRAVMGLLILIPAWLSVVYLRSMVNGEWVVLLVLLIVAAADVGAYFSGRQFGRTKLAPAVSPGKSWEGVLGGALLAVVVAAIYVTVLSDTQHSPKSLIIVVVVALISVVGDLLESMVKRVSGVKDSSDLLPGHGGVLDRVDGLVAALPVISLGFLLTQWQW
jgi:phosphatidate cytidylyltransferase